jgi:hypothetical protein
MNPGSTPAISVDKAFGAASISQRTDTETTYSVKEFSTAAVALQITEFMIISLAVLK